MSTLSTIWENNDGCAEQYRCDSALYLVSVCWENWRANLVQVKFTFCGSSQPTEKNLKDNKRKG